MKLKYLHHIDYKIFHDFSIDFCVDSLPADIIVIAGINGTGKTTLLGELLSNGNNMHVEDEQRGNVTFVDTQTHESLITDIKSFRIFYSFEIIYYPAAFVEMRSLINSVTTYIDRIVFEEGKTSTEAYRDLQQKIDFIFEDFHLGTQFYGMDRNRKLIFTNSKGDKFGVEGLSNGEKQILGKVFPLFTDEISGKVILMDEPEESLHPAWQSNLVPVLRRCAKENNCQFILATHSPQIISSVYAEELRLLIRTDDNKIEAVKCDEGPYGWTVEKVLSEIQHVPNLRVPEVDEKLSRLSDMIEKNQYETDNFLFLWNEMEQTLGYSDKDLVLMRMEILRKKKRNEEDC